MILYTTQPSLLAEIRESIPSRFTKLLFGSKSTTSSRRAFWSSRNGKLSSTPQRSGWERSTPYPFARMERAEGIATENLGAGIRRPRASLKQGDHGSRGVEGEEASLEENHRIDAPDMNEEGG